MVGKWLGKFPNGLFFYLSLLCSKFTIMATVKFRLKAKTDNSQIFLRFSISRNQVFETKTGLTANYKDWSIEKSQIKQTKAENKIIAIQLNDLSNFIHKEYNSDFSKAIIFSTNWLKKKIDLFFGRNSNPENDDLFSIYLSNYIELRKMDSNIKNATIQKFIQMQTKIKAFEKKQKNQFLVTEFDKKLMLEFRIFMLNDCKVMESTANRTLRCLKTVLLDAQNNGKNINRLINNFTIENVPSIKIFLNFEEIEKIKNAKVIGDDLITAKHWLIIGCYTGQRVSDLLDMNSSKVFIKIDNEGNKFPILELTQIKTGNDVSIPLHDEVLKILEIYNGNFPPTFGKATDSNFVLFNRYIKKVCEVAGINNIVKGKVFNDELKRNEIKETEKYKLVSSHICRRSFATNFYGDKRFTTPQIMSITGHKTERMFLSYIGKTSSDHALQTAKTFREIAQQKIS